MKKLILILALSLGSVWLTPILAEAKPNKGYHYSQKKKVKKHTNKKIKVVRQQRQKVKPVEQPQQVYTRSEDESNAQFFARDKEAKTVQQETIRNNFARTSRGQYGGDLVGMASNYIGSNAYQLGLPPRLWCADFVNKLVGGSDRRAISYVQRGRAAYYGCTNCVAVTKRKGGHHVGIVKGYDNIGNIIMISGNHNRRVGVGVYSRNRVVALRYV
jgi:uncharacterized protein (TIGR02594 family)